MHLEKKGSITARQGKYQPRSRVIRRGVSSERLALWWRFKESSAGTLKLCLFYLRHRSVTHRGPISLRLMPLKALSLFLFDRKWKLHLLTSFQWPTGSGFNLLRPVWPTATTSACHHNLLPPILPGHLLVYFASLICVNRGHCGDNVQVSVWTSSGQVCLDTSSLPQI